MSVPSKFFKQEPISPLLEMGAYEYLWLQDKSSFKKISEIFHSTESTLPSDFVSYEDAKQTAEKVFQIITDSEIGSYGVRIHGVSQYPETLRDAKYPVEFLYYQGIWDLVDSPKSVAVVGSRKPTDEGKSRTRKLVRQLIDLDFTIVSGLAEGVDTIAHTTAIENEGRTIAVIGTPITDFYPKNNRQLQSKIASNFLVVSQVPILRYRNQNWRVNRFFFPERNKTMSALSNATIIVEAGETSGTLVQARAAFEQGRKLFILDSCFKNSNITWPAKFEAKGAIRVRDIDDIKRGLDVD